MATARRTTHRSSAGKKLYAVRDAGGKFKDIQTFERAHRDDIAHNAASETSAKAKSARRAAKAAATKAATAKRAKKAKTATAKKAR
jgi:hypothetical protein